LKTLAVIPARYASTRFPGKPLALIAGKPMIEHVWEGCLTSGVEAVIVATEDERIVSACRKFGATAELTRADHASGTDRVAEVSSRHPEFDIVLNVQGDEPGMPPEVIRAVAKAVAETSCDIATAAAPLTNTVDLANPNVVKVVTALDGRALYFSRSSIPFQRDRTTPPPAYLRHLGIYGFRRVALQRASKLTPSPLELTEALEQLRWLQSGLSIHCALVSTYSVGIDTPEDLLAFEQTLTSPRA
jgi:3-deoxy-manno-octulosonate cytidylyltransferase (CMP-KDO synthetase)